MSHTSLLDVTFTPAEFALLPQRNLEDVVCVVFDVLRATSTMIAALANGAERIVPVSEIAEALAWKQKEPGVLLAGERDGVRIRADRTGSVDFDLGNSPREFTPDRVTGRTIIMTTTNGTRALRACAGAREVLLGAFLNLTATLAHLQRRKPARLLLVCAGTGDQASFEDALGAGALADAVWPAYEGGIISDSARIARQLHFRWHQDLAGAMMHARNGRRLLAQPELADDVGFCLRRNWYSTIGRLAEDGSVVRM
jgi:2-phosphosulfolactate phosphatase